MALPVRDQLKYWGIAAAVFFVVLWFLLPSLEIASRMIQVVPAITGLIDRLEKLGLVTRKRCSADRRVVFVALTEKAVTLLKEIDEPGRELHQRLIGHLTKSELKELSRLLVKARKSGAVTEIAG